MSDIPESPYIAGITNRWFDNDRVLVVVVAVATEEIDWAAYQDAYSTVLDNREHDVIKRELIDRATKNGDKISEAEARALFPGINLPYRH